MELPRRKTDIPDGAIIHSPIEKGGYESLVQVDKNGCNTLSFLVKGVHCAACIQKIESALLSDSTVKNARLNFSTGRLNVIWDGALELANTYAQKIESLGYGVHPYSADIEKSESEKEWKFLLLCLGVAGFAMGNIMLLSVGLWITSTETMGSGTREFLHWFSALIGVPAVLFSGRPFFRSAWGALKNKMTNMDVPISLALILATGMSLFELMNAGEHVYFDSAVMLMFFLLIGRVLDFKARRSARSAATDLMSTLSGFANIIEKGVNRMVPIQDLREGMSVLVAAGETVPIDGMVVVGKASIDTSLVTGETLPRVVDVGGDVYAGTLNLDAPLTIKVAKAVGDTLLADIVRLMEKAEQGQAKYVRLADRAARLYTPVVHTFAVMAFLLWWIVLGASWQTSLMVAVTVLIITCPCALGLAVPVVQVLASGVLMKSGILVKAGDALERLACVDKVFLDKTGTLTLGKPELISNISESDLKVAASLAIHSQHVLSQALTHRYDGTFLDVENIQEHAGQGLEGILSDKPIRLGKRDWCGNAMADSYMGPELWLDYNRKKVQFQFSDQLREDAQDVIAYLKKQSVDPILVSGDRSSVAEVIAKQCGIEEYYGDLTPRDKFDHLEKIQKKGHRVLMVGDGLNDAPVLSGAYVSMAPGSAIDMAQNAADIVFMGDRMEPVSIAHEVARKTQKLVKQNFMLAIIYNVVAVPIAFTGLVTPMIAAIAMSGSSLLVIANSFRLKLRS